MWRALLEHRGPSAYPCLESLGKTSQRSWCVSRAGGKTGGPLVDTERVVFQAEGTVCAMRGLHMFKELRAIGCWQGGGGDDTWKAWQGQDHEGSWFHWTLLPKVSLLLSSTWPNSTFYLSLPWFVCLLTQFPPFPPENACGHMPPRLIHQQLLSQTSVTVSS